MKKLYTADHEEVCLCRRIIYIGESFTKRYHRLGSGVYSEVEYTAVCEKCSKTAKKGQNEYTYQT